MPPRIPIPIETRAAVWDASGGVCAYCNESLHPILTFTVDHVVAVANGGNNDLANLVASCKPCNSRKHAKDVEAFRNRTPVAPKPRATPRVVTGWVLDRKKLMRHRRNAVLTQRELADLAGIAYPTLSRLEKGHVATAQPLTIRKLADAFGVPPVELMSEIKATNKTAA